MHDKLLAHIDRHNLAYGNLRRRVKIVDPYELTHGSAPDRHTQGPLGCQHYFPKLNFRQFPDVSYETIDPEATRLNRSYYTSLKIERFGYDTLDASWSLPEIKARSEALALMESTRDIATFLTRAPWDWKQSHWAFQGRRNEKKAPLPMLGLPPYLVDALTAYRATRSDMHALILYRFAQEYVSLCRNVEMIKKQTYGAFLTSGYKDEKVYAWEDDKGEKHLDYTRDERGYERTYFKPMLTFLEENPENPPSLQTLKLQGEYIEYKYNNPHGLHYFNFIFEDTALKGKGYLWTHAVEKTAALEVEAQKRDQHRNGGLAGVTETDVQERRNRAAIREFEAYRAFKTEGNSGAVEDAKSGHKEPPQVRLAVLSIKLLFIHGIISRDEFNAALLDAVNVPKLPLPFPYHVEYGSAWDTFDDVPSGAEGMALVAVLSHRGRKQGEVIYDHVYARKDYEFPQKLREFRKAICTFGLLDRLPELPSTASPVEKTSADYVAAFRARQEALKNPENRRTFNRLKHERKQAALAVRETHEAAKKAYQSAAHEKGRIAYEYRATPECARLQQAVDDNLEQLRAKREAAKQAEKAAIKALHDYSRRLEEAVMATKAPKPSAPSAPVLSQEEREAALRSYEALKDSKHRAKLGLSRSRAKLQAALLQGDDHKAEEARRHVESMRSLSEAFSIELKVTKQKLGKTPRK